MLILPWLPPNKKLLAGPAESGTPYEILREAVQAFLEAESVTLPTGYTVDDLACILWSYVHGMAMLQETLSCHYECEFDSLHRWVFEVLSKGLKAA